MKKYIFLRLQTLISALALLGLAACSNEELVSVNTGGPVTINTNPMEVAENFLNSGDGTLTGRVINAADNTPLAGVNIELFFESGDTEFTRNTFTNEVGEYVIDDLPRGVVYSFDITLDTFLAETFGAVVIDPVLATTVLDLEPIRLISSDNAGVGGISGVIVDATTGDPAAGVTLEFFDGINVTGGPLAATVLTDVDGAYNITDLDAGSYTGVIFGDGLQTSIITVFVIGNTTVSAQNGTISPLVPVGATRIVLIWGENPRDLDGRLTGPTIDGTSAFDVFFGNRTEDDVKLDTDDLSSYGPETITISDSSRPGVFRYSVFNFTGGGASALSNSGARVEVFRAGGIVAEFFVPQGEGNLWSVFDMVQGEIQAIGSVTTLSTGEEELFAPETIVLDEAVMVTPRIKPTKK